MLQCLAIKREGSEKFAEGDWESALVKYRTGLELLKNESDEDPTVSDVRVALLTNLALCHIKTEEFDTAVEVASQALAIHPRHPKALYRRALAYVELHQLHEAAQDVSDLISLNQVDPLVLKLLERIKSLAKDEDEKARSNDLVDAFSVVKRSASNDELSDTKALKLAIEVLISHLMKYGRPESLLREPLFELTIQMLQTFDYSDQPQIEVAGRMLRLLELLCMDSTSSEKELEMTSVDQDVSVGAACADRRKELQAIFPVAKFVTVVASLISAGVSEQGEPVKIARFNVVTSVLGLAQVIGSLDGREWLKILADGLACVECEGVRERAVTAFAKLCHVRRIAGLRAKAFLMTHELQCCLEALADLIEFYHLPQDPLFVTAQKPTTEAIETTRKLTFTKQIEFAFACAFTLLSDKERKTEEEVNWCNLLQSLAGSRLSGASQNDTAAGLSILNIAWLANKQEVFAYSLMNSIPIVALSHALEPTLEDVHLQRIAAEFLINCLEFVELRQMIIDADCVDLIANITQTTGDLELKGLLAAVLARMCLHGDAERELIFDKVDFFPLSESVVKKLGEELKASEDEKGDGKRKRDATEDSGREIANARRNRLVLRVLQVLYFLSLHADFKREMLGLSPALLKKVDAETQRDKPIEEAALPQAWRPALVQLTDAAKPSPILSSLACLGKVALSAKKSEACFLFVALINNLVRSRDEKDRLKKNKNAPDFDEEQMQQLQLIFDKLPEKARPQKQSHFDQGSTLLCQTLRSFLLQENAVVPLLRDICSASDLVTSHLLKLASSAIRSFVYDGQTRAHLFRQGAVTIILKTIDAFANAPDEIRDFRQTLARIAMSIPPTALRYEEIMACTSQLVPLLSDQSELMTYEACLALTNFMAVSEEVRVFIWADGKGWWRLEDVASSDNGMLRAAGLECLCNMTESERVLETMSSLCRQRKMGWQPNLLMAFVSDLENHRAVIAALGCLASLSLSPNISLRLVEKVKGDIGHLMETSDFSITTADAPMQIRAAHCLVNLWDSLHEALLDDQLRDGDTNADNALVVGNGLDNESVTKALKMLFLGLPVLAGRMSPECQALIHNRLKMNLETSPMASILQKAQEHHILDSAHTQFWLSKAE